MIRKLGTGDVTKPTKWVCGRRRPKNRVVRESRDRLRPVTGSFFYWASRVLLGFAVFSLFFFVLLSFWFHRFTGSTAGVIHS